MPDVEYTQLDGNIHKFVFHHATRQSVHDFIETADALLKDTPESSYFALLIDFRPDGMPLLNYSSARLRALFGRHPHVTQYFGAYLYENSLIISLLSTFLDLLRLHSTRKFFKGDADAEAMEWLKAEIEAVEEKRV